MCILDETESWLTETLSLTHTHTHTYRMVCVNCWLTHSNSTGFMALISSDPSGSRLRINTRLYRAYITSSEMYSLHLTHPKWTHTRSSGQPCYSARGAVGGSVPCSRTPQSWYWRRILPPPTIPAGPEIRTHNLWITSPTRYPLGHDCPPNQNRVCIHTHTRLPWADPQSIWTYVKMSFNQKTSLQMSSANKWCWSFSSYFN